MFEPLLFRRLRGARRVLLAGAGGGFDVYSALPLGLVLADAGVRVDFASLSFAYLDALSLDVWLAEGVAAIRPDTPSSFDDYFPERTLARWLAGAGLDPVVYAFPKMGVKPLRAAYRSLLEHTGADAVVLVDGGTDLLLRGDESGLGTPEEDMVSLAALRGIDSAGGKGLIKLAAGVGFGIDAYHGVNHVQVLENIAALERDGAYLGAFSIPVNDGVASSGAASGGAAGSGAASSGPDGRPEGVSHVSVGARFLDAVDQAQAATASHPSIVQGQVAAAMRGGFGDVRFTERTRGSELFVNPLMGLYFTFELDGLAARNLYLDRIEDTVLMRQVSSIIGRFRDELPATRRPRIFPH